MLNALKALSFCTLFAFAAQPLVGQTRSNLDDALTTAIRELHAGVEGKRIALIVPESILAKDVSLSAARKLQAAGPTEESAHKDPVDVIYRVGRATVTGDTVMFYVSTTYHRADYRNSIGRRVWVVRKGAQWVAVRVRNISIS